MGHFNQTWQNATSGDEDSVKCHTFLHWDESNRNDDKTTSFEIFFLQNRCAYYRKPWF